MAVRVWLCLLLVCTQSFGAVAQAQGMASTLERLDPDNTTQREAWMLLGDTAKSLRESCATSCSTCDVATALANSPLSLASSGSNPPTPHPVFAGALRMACSLPAESGESSAEGIENIHASDFMVRLFFQVGQAISYGGDLPEPVAKGLARVFTTLTSKLPDNARTAASKLLSGDEVGAVSFLERQQDGQTPPDMVAGKSTLSGKRETYDSMYVFSRTMKEHKFVGLITLYCIIILSVTFSQLGSDVVDTRTPDDMTKQFHHTPLAAVLTSFNFFGGVLCAGYILKKMVPQLEDLANPKSKIETQYFGIDVFWTLFAFIAITMSTLACESVAWRGGIPWISFILLFTLSIGVLVRLGRVKIKEDPSKFANVATYDEARATITSVKAAVFTLFGNLMIIWVYAVVTAMCKENFSGVYDFLDALTFVAVTHTTVGYGDRGPLQGLGKFVTTCHMLTVYLLWSCSLFEVYEALSSSSSATADSIDRANHRLLSLSAKLAEYRQHRAHLV